MNATVVYTKKLPSNKCPRRVSFALREKLQVELEHLEKCVGN